jgi:hypothetical protein
MQWIERRREKGVKNRETKPVCDRRTFLSLARLLAEVMSESGRKERRWRCGGGKVYSFFLPQKENNSYPYLPVSSSATMRILAASHGTRPTFPGASKSAPPQRAGVLKAAPKANAKVAVAAADGDDAGGIATSSSSSSSSDATSSVQRCALAAAGLAASLIMVRRANSILRTGVI